MYTTDRTLKAVSFSPWKYCNLHSITFFIAFIQSLFNIINYSVLTFLTFWSPQIDDLETLEAAREDDLHRAGFKMGDIIKIRRVLQARSKESPLNSSLSSLYSVHSLAFFKFSYSKRNALQYFFMGCLKVNWKIISEPSPCSWSPPPPPNHWAHKFLIVFTPYLTSYGNLLQFTFSE